MRASKGEHNRGSAIGAPCRGFPGPSSSERGIPMSPLNHVFRRGCWVGLNVHACVRACARAYMYEHVYVMELVLDESANRICASLCARIYESLRRRREGGSSIIAALWRSRTVDVLSTDSAVRAQWPTLMD